MHPFSLPDDDIGSIPRMKQPMQTGRGRFFPEKSPSSGRYRLRAAGQSAIINAEGKHISAGAFSDGKRRRPS